MSRALSRAAAGGKKARKRPPRARQPTDRDLEDARRERQLWGAAEFGGAVGVEGATISKRLRAARISPASVNGHLKYHLKDLIDATYLRDAAGATDPDKLNSYQRKAFFDSELNRLALEQKAGRLVPVEDLERRVAEVFKDVARFRDTIGDRLERDGVLSGASLERFEAHFQAAMGELADVVSGKSEAAK